MHHFLVFLPMFFTTLSFAQVENEEIDAFWSVQIRAIIDLDVKSIDKYTAHPPGGDWGFVIGLEDDTGWSHDTFMEHLEFIFFEELRAYLSEGTPELVEVWNNEDGLFLVIKFNEVFVEDDMEYESTTILQFSKMEGIWKLSDYFVAG